MSLESIFNETMNIFLSKIQQFKQIDPNLANVLGFNSNDPHIERMIAAFGVIASSFKEDMEKKSSRELRSLLCNLFPDVFSPYTPKGILSFQPDKCFFLPENFNINCGGTIFKTDQGIFINKIKISNIEYKNVGRKHQLEISFLGTDLENIKQIDVFANQEIISAMFFGQENITGTLQRNNLFESDVLVKWNFNFQLQDFCLFIQNYYFFSIMNLNFQKDEKSFKIIIPIKYKINPDIDNFILNCTTVKNQFLSTTFPFEVKGPGEYFLQTQENQKIRQILNLVDINGKKYPNINKHKNGWHTILRENNHNIFIDYKIPNGEYFCEVECFNNFIETSNIVFEKFIPASCNWVKYPNESFTFEYSNLISSFINYFNNKTEDPIECLNNAQAVLSCFNLDSQIEFYDIDVMNCLSYERYGSFTLPILGKIVTANCDITNLIYIKGLCSMAQARSETPINFRIHTPKGNLDL